MVGYGPIFVYSDSSDQSGYGLLSFHPDGVDVVQTATVVLTNAQILTLPTTPVTIVKAPANSYIVPLSSLWERDFSGGDYTNVSTADFDGMSLDVDGGGDGSLNWLNYAAEHNKTYQEFFQPVLNSKPTKSIVMLPGGGYHVFEGFSITSPPPTFVFGDLLPLNNLNLTLWRGGTWRILVSNTPGNFTGGNVANKMAVTLIYTVISSFVP